MDYLNVKAVLIDIEGTTTSISFVKDKLFPYVVANLAAYIEKNWDNEETKEDVKTLKQQCDEDKKAGLDGLVEIENDSKDSLAKNVLWQMENDRKTTGLKQLQGHMWREGYGKGDLKGHLYDDVAESLKVWKKAGKSIYVYSSGSVEAQKLLFANSVSGDLVDLFTGFFDTAVGGKTVKESYCAILKEMGLDAKEVLFLTDVAKEAAAARDAGLQTVIVVRDGNVPLDDETKKDFTVIETFEEIVFEPSAKRAKIADEKTEDLKTGTDAKSENGEKMEVDVVAAVTEPPKLPAEQVISVEKQPEINPKETENDGGNEISKNVEKPAGGDETIIAADAAKPANGDDLKPEEDAKQPENGKPVELVENEDGKSNGHNGNSDAIAAKTEIPAKDGADEPAVTKPIPVENSAPIELAAE